jgi:hypothetical protein
MEEKRIHMVLRTCDRHSLQSTRIVNKKECIIRCLNSILTELEVIDNKHLHIIDDNSSEDFKSILNSMVGSLPFVSLDFLPARDQSQLSAKKKSRYSVQVAYEYIYNLPDNDLVYIVEDDYLHLPGSIAEMIDTWSYFTNTLETNIGIFPQDFNQLYYHPSFPHNQTYFQAAFIVPARTRYYRTTWFTHESFMLQSGVFKKYKTIFDKLLDIGGDDPACWEGSTISSVWNKPDVKMFMPMGSLVVHMSSKTDIPFFISEEQVIKLWKENKTSWSSEQDSQVLL